MSLGAAYQPVDLPNGDSHEADEFRDEPREEETPARMEPLELGSSSSGGGGRSSTDETKLLHRQVNEQVVEPFLSLTITTFLVIPTLLLAMIVAFHITSRIWTCVLFAMHLLWALVKARVHFQDLEKCKSFSQTDQVVDSTFPTSSYSDTAEDHPEDPENDRDEDDTEEAAISEGVLVPSQNKAIPASKGVVHFWLTSFPSLLDILLFGILYPTIIGAFRDFFVEINPNGRIKKRQVTRHDFVIFGGESGELLDDADDNPGLG